MLQILDYDGFKELSEKSVSIRQNELPKDLEHFARAHFESPCSNDWYEFYKDNDGTIYRVYEDHQNPRWTVD